MPRIFLVSILMALTTAIACDGGNGSRMSVKMTVKEYAASCADLGNQLDLPAFDNISDTGDINDAVESMGEFLDELKSWNPPGEVRELHELRIEGAEFAVNYLTESGFGELLVEVKKAEREDDLERMLELAGKLAPLVDGFAELEDFDDKIEAAENDLSSETYNVLEQADCI